MNRFKKMMKQNRQHDYLYIYILQQNIFSILQWKFKYQSYPQQQQQVNQNAQDFRLRKNLRYKPILQTLQDQQKLYAYYFTRACWEGAKICYFQRSYEAPGLFYLFQKIFSLQKPSDLGYQLLTRNGFKVEEVKQIFVYVAAFFQNCGNYKSFGDSKFVPEVSKGRFLEFIHSTKAYHQERETFNQIWNLVEFELYEFNKPYGLIDLVEKEGQNSYYSSGLKKEFLDKIEHLMIEKKVSFINTRVVERENVVYILVASGERKDLVDFGEVDGRQIKLQYGDFAPFLREVYKNLEKAAQYAANDNQKNMLKDYVEHFISGDMEKHRDSQKHWIQDKGPLVETNIGFIETYLDPLKIRAEFEGFVAVVNQTESKLLNNLVNQAEKIIQYLPWPKEFEIEQFSRPDFTSLEILAFACSGTPIGINIPNYDDIRQNLGFKNVNLGNVYGKPSVENIRYIEGQNVDLFIKYYQSSLFLVVALHELIGHGSGKLFMKEENGELNFNPETVFNPINNEKVTTYYNHGENWHSRFGELSGAYEECKADAVALYLSTYDDVVDILLPQYSLDEKLDAVKAAWLDIVLGALKGLEYYSPDQKKWGQPHILASYVLFQVMVKEDPEMIKFQFKERDGKDYFTIDFNYEKIWTSGKTAIGKLLQGLQVYKSTGLGKEGLAFFEQYTQVTDEMIKIRAMVLEHKTPRKIELQQDVQLNSNGKVDLIQFEESHEGTFKGNIILLGVIESHIFHYGGRVGDVLELFLTQQQEFRVKN